jgi:uncharacterized protein (UPF0335 family)
MTEDVPGVGDNALDPEVLKGFVDRIETLEAEKAQIAEEIKDVYDEAKEAALSRSALKLLIRRRRRDPKEVAAEEEALEAYERSLRKYLKGLGVK